MLRANTLKSLARPAFLSSVAGLAIASPAYAQDPETRIQTDAEAVAEADAPAIIVTGTRQSDRSAADTVAPVDVVGEVHPTEVSRAHDVTAPGPGSGSRPP